MNFYLDLEATQPGNEIISIGMVAENGDYFKTLVRPERSQITDYITKLTGIKPSDVENAPNANMAFKQLMNFVWDHEPALEKCNIYTYGDSDRIFVEESLKSCFTMDSILYGSYFATHLIDFTITAKKYFQGNISLIHAYNYLKASEYTQKHDALEDAIMLQYVFDNIKDKEPLESHPSHCEELEKNGERPGVISPNCVMPSGTFSCKAGGKNATVHEFACCDDAIDWLINTKVNKEARETVHRDRIMKNIMKAIRTKSTYMEYKWSRMKGV